MKICPDCRRAYADRDWYCGTDGARLIEVSPADYVAARSQEAQSAAEEFEADESTAGGRLPDGAALALADANGERARRGTIGPVEPSAGGKPARGAAGPAARSTAREEAPRRKSGSDAFLKTASSLTALPEDDRSGPVAKPAPAQVKRETRAGGRLPPLPAKGAAGGLSGSAQAPKGIPPLPPSPGARSEPGKRSLDRSGVSGDSVDDGWRLPEEQDLEEDTCPGVGPPKSPRISEEQPAQPRGGGADSVAEAPPPAAGGMPLAAEGEEVSKRYRLSVTGEMSALVSADSGRRRLVWGLLVALVLGGLIAAGVLIAGAGGEVGPAEQGAAEARSAGGASTETRAGAASVASEAQGGTARGEAEADAPEAAPADPGAVSGAKAAAPAVRGAGQEEGAKGRGKGIGGPGGGAVQAGEAAAARERSRRPNGRGEGDREANDRRRQAESRERGGRRRVRAKRDREGAERSPTAAGEGRRSRSQPSRGAPEDKRPNEGKGDDYRLERTLNPFAR